MKLNKYMLFGLNIWKDSPDGKILETDVVIVKDNLTKEELGYLEFIVSAFLVFLFKEFDNCYGFSIKD